MSLVAGGGVGSFVLSINYCQLNALSIFSILYHLAKAFIIHAKNRGYHFVKYFLFAFCLVQL